MSPRALLALLGPLVPLASQRDGFRRVSSHICMPFMQAAGQPTRLGAGLLPATAGYLRWQRRPFLVAPRVVQVLASPGQPWRPRRHNTATSLGVGAVGARYGRGPVELVGRTAPDGHPARSRGRNKYAIRVGPGARRQCPEAVPPRRPAGGPGRDAARRDAARNQSTR